MHILAFSPLKNSYRATITFGQFSKKTGSLLAPPGDGENPHVKALSHRAEQKTNELLRQQENAEHKVRYGHTKDECTGDHQDTSNKPHVCPDPSCNGAEHPVGHEACAHHDFGSYTHNIYHWVKSTTEWLLPDSWNLDWLGDHTGSMAAGILDPLTLGITATSALASAGALYFYSKLHSAKQ